MTLEVSRIDGISDIYYWGGISYTINKLVEWWVTPVYEVVYSIRDTSPLYSLRDTAYTKYRLYEIPPHQIF
jgi:hypothetical protein